MRIILTKGIKMKKLMTLVMLFSLSLSVNSAQYSQLLEKSNPSPMQEFTRWQLLAKEQNTPLLEVGALATVDDQQQPHQRFMYIKKVSPEGFIFETHASTNKAKQFVLNKKASVVFIWPFGTFDLQVRANGIIEQKGLVNPKSTKLLDKDFYEYVLKPDFVQFSISNLDADVVNNDYVTYTSQGHGQWEIKHTNYQYPHHKS